MNQNKTTFPSPEELKRVRKEISRSNHRVNIGLSLNATPTEKAKYELCQDIARYQRENNLTEKKLAQKLGIEEKKAEYILFGHINKFTLDKLIDYANSLHITTEIRIPLPYERKETTRHAV
ncbi:XRE family transcriptional regulator [endosymbiont GvMRE of Glomus versiforme]|uniref:XRE family transcriptional regulator n=1 Tax=endosymbiont GvMRE of Glomus versiforme TaxID=2039283 RepID=UPI000ECDDC13|nr:XRE family transcriptional regulator [endosymbiont GvMRE of Glomus versiforme]RHZ35893.1 XRE family transcriptional regulator [endosymbiont GvMRE of Glomus versiforme]